MVPSYVSVDLHDQVFVVVAETDEAMGPFGSLGIRVCTVDGKIGSLGKTRLSLSSGATVSAWLESDGTVTPDIADVSVVSAWPLSWHTGHNLAEAYKNSLESAGLQSVMRMVPRCSHEEAQAMIRTMMSKESPGDGGFSFAISARVAESFDILSYLDFVSTEKATTGYEFHMIGPLVVTRIERGFQDGPDRVLRHEMQYGRLSYKDMSRIVTYAREKNSGLA